MSYLNPQCAKCMREHNREMTLRPCEDRFERGVVEIVDRQSSKLLLRKDANGKVLNVRAHAGYSNCEYFG